MSRKLNVALLNSGHFHAGMFLNIVPNLGHKITAISCEDKKKLEEQAKAFEARPYADYKELLENESDIDFAICCGVHAEAADMLDMLVEKGIPFCTEKPITDNIDRMRRIVKNARNRQLFSDVVLPLRFSPIILAFEEFRKKNHTGEIAHCYFRNMAGSIDRYRKWGCAWMLEKARALGGPFMNEGAHYIDLFRYLTGEEIKSVQAGMNNGIYHESIDDNFSAILETHSGKRAVIEICYGYPTNNNWRDLAVVINTENYLFVLIDQENPRAFKLEAKSRKDCSSEIIDLRACEQNVYEVYVKEMFKRFLSGKDGIIPVSNFLGTQIALANAYISAEGNRKVSCRDFGEKDLLEMHSEIAGWLLNNQVMDSKSKYFGSIYYPTEKRYCNRDTACLASCFMRQYVNTSDNKWLERADLARKNVLSVQLENGGYPELRNLEQSDDGSAVNTSIVADNLIKAYQAGLAYDQKDVSALSRMADFELCLEWEPGAFYHDTEHLGIPRYKDRTWGKEGSKIDCHNTTALSAMMLQKIYYFLKENDCPVKQAWLDAASRAIKHLPAVL
ncbi:MAG: Gfo/Idh/MocA family oxidoreductase, partial [Verrucomicrobia bacterium]|nr:Gfo/Idh/MocA family oxidoreductase [Verrucomicrobiota bacterium]